MNLELQFDKKLPFEFTLKIECQNNRYVFGNIGITHIYLQPNAFRMEEKSFDTLLQHSLSTVLSHILTLFQYNIKAIHTIVLISLA